MNGLLVSRTCDACHLAAYPQATIHRSYSILQKTTKLVLRKRNIQNFMFRKPIETCTVCNIAIVNRLVLGREVLRMVEMTDPGKRNVAWRGRCIRSCSGSADPTVGVRVMPNALKTFGRQHQDKELRDQQVRKVTDMAGSIHLDDIGVPALDTATQRLGTSSSAEHEATFEHQAFHGEPAANGSRSMPGSFPEETPPP